MHRNLIPGHLGRVAGSPPCFSCNREASPVCAEGPRAPGDLASPKTAGLFSGYYKVPARPRWCPGRVLDALLEQGCCAEANASVTARSSQVPGGPHYAITSVLCDGISSPSAHPPTAADFCALICGSLIRSGSALLTCLPEPSLVLKSWSFLHFLEPLHTLQLSLCLLQIFFLVGPCLFTPRMTSYATQGVSSSSLVSPGLSSLLFLHFKSQGPFPYPQVMEKLTHTFSWVWTLWLSRLHLYPLGICML